MKLTRIVIFCVLYLVFGNIAEALITVPHKHVHHAGPYVPVPAPLIPHGGPLDRGYVIISQFYLLSLNLNSYRANHVLVYNICYARQVLV